MSAAWPQYVPYRAELEDDPVCDAQALALGSQAAISTAPSSQETENRRNFHANAEGAQVLD